MLDQLLPAGLHDQIALLVERKLAHTPEAEPDRTRVGARRKPKVVFKLALFAAVVDQIDSGIDIVQLDGRVIGDIDMPLLGVIADEIVGLARHLIDAADFRHARRALECDSHDRGLAPNPCGPSPGRRAHRRASLKFCTQLVGGRFDRFGKRSARHAPRRIAQRKHRLGRGQEQRVALPAREKLDLRIALARVLLEAHRHSGGLARCFLAKFLRVLLRRRHGYHPAGCLGIRRWRYRRADSRSKRQDHEGRKRGCAYRYRRDR